MKKCKKTSKKILSLLLAVFLLVGTVELGFGGLMSLNASAAVNVGSGSLPTVSIAVPETIYLTPASSATAFQYYLNNTAAGQTYNYVTNDGFDKYDNAGYIEFTCADYAGQNITVTADNATFKTSASGTAAASATVTANGSGKITLNIAGGSMTGVSAGGTSTITWTFSAGSTEIAKAYTVAYAPFLGAVAAFGEANAYRGYDDSYRANGAISTVIYGIHGITSSYTGKVKIGSTTYHSNNSGTDDNDTVDNTGSYVPQPLTFADMSTSSLIFWDGTGTPGSTLFSTSGSGAAETHASAANSNKAMKANGGTGYVYYDSSRATTFADIPNLGMYMDYHGCYRNKHLETSSYSEDIYYLDAAAFKNTGSNNTVTNSANAASGSYTSTSTAQRYLADKSKYSSWTLADGKTIVCVGTYNSRCEGALGGVGSTVTTKEICNCDLKAVNKSSLRALVSTDVGAKSSYASGWENYQTRLKEACAALGDPTATAVSDSSTAYTNLSNAIAGLSIGGSTATATHVSSTGKTLPTETKTYNYGDTVTAAANSYTGYTYTSVNPTTTTYTNVTTPNLSWTFTYTPINYPINYTLNGGTNASSNPTSYTVETSSPITFANPTRTGYTFTGWNIDGYIVNDTAEYSGSCNAGEGKYTDFKSYSISAPFSQGDVYVMECDVKGTGPFYNYFYGDSNYLQVAKSVSEGEIPEGDRDTNRTNNTDGNNHILNSGKTTNGVYKHYKVTFTLSGTGDGSVNKIILFRAWNGSNVTIKNVTVRKISGTTGNSYTIPTNNPTGIALVANWTPNPIDVTYDNLFDVNEFAENADKGSLTSFSVDKSTGVITTKADNVPTETKKYTNMAFDKAYIIPAEAEKQYLLSYEQYVNSMDNLGAEAYVTFWDASGNTLSLDDLDNYPALGTANYPANKLYYPNNGDYLASNSLNDNLAYVISFNGEYQYTPDVWSFTSGKGVAHDTAYSGLWNADLGLTEPGYAYTDFRFITPPNTAYVTVNFGCSNDYTTGNKRDVLAKFKNVSLSRLETYTLDDPTNTFDVDAKTDNGSYYNVKKVNSEFLGWTIGDTATFFTDRTDLLDYTGGINLRSNWIKSNITLGSMNDEDILDSKVTISKVKDKDNMDVPIGSETTVIGTNVDLKVSSDGNISYTPKNMTWSAPEKFSYKLSIDEGSDSYRELTVFPQTTILYEETEDSCGYEDQDGKPVPSESVSGSLAWTTVDDNSPAIYNGEKSKSSVYGYSDSYADLYKYSDNHAMRTTVTDGHTVIPTYKFTFVGTGVDIISTCDQNSGLMVIGITNADSEHSQIQYQDPEKNENYWFADTAVNTHCSTPIYQEVVYHEEGLVYGEYEVTVKAVYSEYFDLTDQDTSTLNQAGFDTVVPENGSIVDLSDILGEEYSECKYYCMDNSSYRSGNDDIIDFEPIVVKGDSDSTPGYNVTIDGVRVYNPADPTNEDIRKQYSNDEELNPTYRKIRDIYTDPDWGTLDHDNFLYVEGVGDNASWTNYNTISERSNAFDGSNTEMELMPSSKNDSYAITFKVKVEDYSSVHISLRAARGIPCTAVVNGYTLNITSTTEQYFDITDYLIESGGQVSIACISDDEDAMLAVCSIKTISGTLPSASSGESIVVFDDSEEALLNAKQMLLSLYEPDAENMDFTVNFGDSISTSATVSEDKFTVEKVGRVWTATAELSNEELNELLADSKNIRTNSLNEENGITVTALYEDGEWVPQIATASVIDKTPEADDIMVFFVDFGNDKLSAVRVNKNNVKVEKIDGTWTATATISRDTLEELLEEAGIADDYKVEGNKVTLTAKMYGDEWHSDLSSASLKKLTWIEKLINAISNFFKLFAERLFRS